MLLEKRGRYVNERLRRSNAIILLIVMAVMLQLVLPVSSATASSEDETIDIQRTVGLQGAYQQGKWFPVEITLTNRTKRDLAGEVVLSVVSSENITTDYIVPVDLPIGTDVQVTIGLPGTPLGNDRSLIRFFEGSYKTGKEVKLSGPATIEGRTLDGSNVIGVVSRDPDTLNFMPTLNLRGYSINVLPLTEEDLPDQSAMLDMLDTLVINDVDTGEWDEDVVKAIRDWVTRGGTLVLSGGAGYAKTARAFAELAPLAATGTTTIESAESLAKAGGAELKLTDPITVSTGQAAKGAAVEISEAGVPLAVSRSYGFGSVVYAAFDPSLEPMSTWSGSASLWAKLLGRNLSNLQGMGGAVMTGNTYIENMFWPLSNIIDQFPSIKPPSFSLLLALFGLYVLIVAPVLYIILAKADRREWGWWLIPAVSVVMGIVIFTFGAGDKKNTSVHAIDIVELSPDGQAVVSGAAAVFSPTGGTVTASFDGKPEMRMYSDNSMINASGNLTLNGAFQFRDTGDGLQTIWRSVPYWSTRKLFMDRRVVDSAETGRIDIAYEGENGAEKLVVTNNTSSDLTHVSLIVNGQAHVIGDLKKGESGSLLNPPTFVPAQPGMYYSYSSMIFPGWSGNNNDEWMRQRELTDQYFNRNNDAMRSSGPVIVGYSTDRENAFMVNGDKVRTDHLTMWVQNIDPTRHVGDRVIISAGVIKPIIASNTLEFVNNYGNGIVNVGAGELILDYMVPMSESVAYDVLDIQTNPAYSNSNLTWSVWHEASGEWVSQLNALGSAHEYFVDDQIIRLKLDAAAAGETMFPYVMLEGEELNP